MNGHTQNGKQEQAPAAEPTQPTSADASASPEEAPPRQEATGAAADAERQRLETELEATRRRLDELARAYQTLDKDREEFKQRLSRERERMIDVERGNVAVTLLEAIDELDRCLTMSGPGANSSLGQGVRMIRDGLLAKVQAAGIERIQVVGQMYDPNTAEAADMEITPEPQEDQRVVAEIRAGYRLKDRIIRPARVKVAKYVPPAQA
ncbi:nucleotide exchange factor GrpE [Stigmatella aurantiaca]|uniref:Protein GrpE n=1 Tax=Stigmatella aurantiaca (strain DW4/3-1) TaxID=378806 RepID=Q095R7_STIAD|nr:nucleotide exchange factor GrpE [Stigmatella aurantiaca]ADO72491.1 co-chaperone GrpE [Stigmatella aurantiaca DW4/3-1]EAU67509.1 co-chaperone GrpE [Stigmatella aurantiaca DW4/3-1]